MDWLILILGVPAILIPLVLLFGFAGCVTAPVCTDDSDCPAGTHCVANSCVVVGPPSAPENLAAAALDDHRVSLTWTNTDPAATVLIERTEDGDDFDAVTPENLENLSATGATDVSPDLQEGVTYIYRVGALGQEGSEPAVFSDDTSSATVFPKAPRTLRARAVSFDQIDLSWTNASAIATQFFVEERVAGTFQEIPGSRGPGIRFSHRNLIEGTRHEYRVFAFVDGVEDDVGPQPINSAPSLTASATTLAFTAVFTAPPGTLTTESDASGFCVVQRLSQTLLARGGTPHTQVRILLRGPTTGSLTIDRVTISQPDPSATADPYDAAPDLTDVAGVNVPPNTPVTIQQNTPVTVGPVNYALDPTQDLLVAFDIRSGNILFGGLTGADFFSNSATAEAGVQDRKSNYENITADILSLIEIIQVL